MSTFIVLFLSCGKRALPAEESIKVQLVWPENDEVVNSFSKNLDWESFPGAGEYIVKIWLESVTTPILVEQTNSSYLEIEAELGDGTYRWAVAVIENGEYKYWSDTLTFHLSQIVLTVTPDDGAIINDTRVYFDWLIFPRANGYEIKVWPEGYPDSPVYIGHEFTSSTKAIVPFFEGDYCWTVGVRYEDEDSFGRWSDTLCFSVDQYPFELVDTLHTHGYPREILPFENVLYVCDGSAGLLICDRTDPLHPVAVMWDEPVGQDVSRAVWVDSITNIMLVADYMGVTPVLGYNISNPLEPQRSDWSSIWPRKSLDVDGVWFRDTLFVAVADYDGGGNLWDFHDTLYQDATPRGGIDENDYTYSVAFAESLLFAACGQKGILISHVLDADSVIGRADTPGEAIRMAISGNLCFVADDIAGLTIIDFSNPTEPIIIGRADPQVGSAQDIYVLGEFCYVACGSGGTVIYDISNPANPIPIQEIDGMYSYSVAADGEIIYIADRDWGIITLSR